MRSIIFYFCFYFLIVSTLILGLPMLLIPRKVVVAYYKFITYAMIWLLKNILNVKCNIEGLENLPSSSCIIASMHQSFWEIMIFTIITKDPTMVLKSDLTLIPIFNLYLRKLQMISVNRKKGDIATLKQQVQNCLAVGRSVVIFPQGSRKMEKLKPGITFLYPLAKVVPVTLDSGNTWPRRGAIRANSQINLRIHRPLDANLSRKQVLEELEKIFSEKAALADV